MSKINKIIVIPTEPVGSIPRSRELQETVVQFKNNEINSSKLESIFDNAVKDTVQKFEETGSNPICDGEQIKSSFVAYPFEGLKNLDPNNGVAINFVDGHKRQLPTLTSGPFIYGKYAGNYVERAKKFTNKPIKEAVIAISAISLIYPETGIEGYSKEQFIKDLIQEGVNDIRSCFDVGAHSVQIDFTEGRLALKFDPSGALLKEFIELNNAVLSHFSEEEIKLIGVHTCPGGDCNSTHSDDVEYSKLIPEFLKINATNFFFQMASEKDPEKSLKLIGENLKKNQRAFIGVIDTCTNEVENEEIVVERIKQAAKYIPLGQLGTTDDCGFSPFGDDVAQPREVAFAKIKARINGTAKYINSLS